MAVTILRLEPSNDIKHFGPEISERKTVPGCCVSIMPVGAGASDAYGRMAASYNLLTSHFDLDIEIEKYRNYHAKDFEFDKTFGMQKGFEFVPDTVDLEHVPIIDLSELVKRVLEDDVPFAPNTRYRIRSDIYPSSPQYKQFQSQKGIRASFFSKMSYQPQQNPFSASPEGENAVLHLRRQDISGRAIFEGVSKDAIGPSIEKLLKIRKPNLDIETAVYALEQSFEAGTKVNVILASDGFKNLEPYYKHHTVALENVARLEADLQAEISSDKLDLNVITRIIGTDPEATQFTMDAMFHADLVVTAYSSFPQLPCRFGKTPYLQLRFEEQAR